MKPRNTLHIRELKYPLENRIYEINSELHSLERQAERDIKQNIPELMLLIQKQFDIYHKEIELLEQLKEFYEDLDL